MYPPESWPHITRRCPVCPARAAALTIPYYPVDKSTAWWEKPNRLASGSAIKATAAASPREPSVKAKAVDSPQKSAYLPYKATVPMPGIRRAPSIMRDFIRLGREELLCFKYEGDPKAMLLRVDVAVRSKCGMIEMPSFETDYSKPVNAARLFQFYRDRRTSDYTQRHRRYSHIDIHKRSSSHRAPGPSPLRQIKSVDDFEVTEESLREVARLELAQREYRKARSEVQLLYLVGTEKTLLEELGGVAFWNDFESVRPDGSDLPHDLHHPRQSDIRG